MPRPRRPLTVRAALTGVLALAVLTGCSGGSSGGGTAEDPLADGVLRVGTEGTYAPFTFHDPETDELTGYDVEVVRAVAEELGVEAEFSETTFDAIFAGLEAERYDVVANQVSVTEERQATYDFSAPYTVSTGAVVTRADDASVTALADVAGKTSAQSTTSNWAEVATTNGATVEAVEGFAQAVTLLEQGRVDVTINDDLAVLNYLETTGSTSVKIAATTQEQTQQAFAFRKDSGLADDVDAALETLRTEGRLAEISQEYFGEDVSG